MVPQNSLISERLAFLATTKPVPTTGGGGTVTSAYVNIIADTNSSTGCMFSRMLAGATVQCDGTSVLTVSVLKASDSAGTGAAAIASQTVASTATSLVLFDVNSFTEALNDTSKTYLAVKCLATTGATGNSGFIIGSDGRYDPASYWNSSGVLLSTNAV